MFAATTEYVSGAPMKCGGALLSPLAGEGWGEGKPRRIKHGSGPLGGRRVGDRALESRQKHRQRPPEHML